MYASIFLEVRLEQQLDPSASTPLNKIKDMKQTPYPQAREHPTFFGIHFEMLWFQKMEIFKVASGKNNLQTSFPQIPGKFLRVAKLQESDL